MALSTEMNGPMTIGVVGWQRGGNSGSPTGHYNNFKLYMGLSEASELSDTFEANYLPGTRVLVYETPTQTFSADPDAWVQIMLDTPFPYNGTDNLVVELEWAGGANMFYTYKWNTGALRALENKTDIYSPTGTLSQNMSQLLFDDPLSLSRYTFGAIKAVWVE